MSSVCGQTDIYNQSREIFAVIVLSKNEVPVTRSCIMQLSPKICMKTSLVDGHNTASPISI